MPARIGRTCLRVVFVLIGAALALSLALLDITLVVLLQESGALAWWLVVILGTLLVVAPIAAVGLVPASRAVYGAAAEPLLGAALPGGFAPAPARTWAQRARTLWWFVLHLVAGAALVTAVVGSVALGSTWLTVLALVGSAVGAVMLGELLAWLAPRLLGPSYAERLAALERDVDRIAERTRIAREIHDSVGHALSLVTVQAAAARKVLANDPDFASSALAAIEDASRTAAADLDRVLGLLRDENADASATAPTLLDLGALDALVAATRSAGLTVDADVTGDLATVPPPVSRHTYRIAQEALTNALRHAPDKTATLTVAVSADLLRLSVVNRCGEKPRGEGRGVRGIEERTHALGGRARVGPDSDVWSVTVELPLREGKRR